MMNDKYLILNINGYFNCKFMMTKANIEKSKQSLQFVGAYGDFLDSDYLPGSLESIHIRGIPFTFPDKSYHKYDSISCEGQILDLPIEKYTLIFMLALSIWSNHHETVKIILEDNSYFNAKVDFKRSQYVKNSWEYDQHSYIPMIECKNLISKEKSHINFIRIIIKDNDKKIKSIELPYNPDILIFAITLVQSKIAS